MGELAEAGPDGVNIYYLVDAIVMFAPKVVEEF
jgi:hypothetical protein